MKFTHHGFEINLRDEWWAEAEMIGFLPKSNIYRVTQSGSKNREIFRVSIEDVGPVIRDPGVGIFNDSIEEGSARERVVRILRGFRLDEAIPPVEVVKSNVRYPYRYKLVDGTHRFYSALAAGFTHVPAVEGFDWNALDN